MPDKKKPVSRISPEIKKFAQEIADKTGVQYRSVLRRFQGERSNKNRTIYDETFDFEEDLTVVHWTQDAAFDNPESPLRIAEDWKRGTQTDQINFNFQLVRITIKFRDKVTFERKELQSRKKGTPGKIIVKETREGYILNVWIAKETDSK